MPVVDVKGFGVVEFPDSMKADAIKATIKRMRQKQQGAVSRETPPEPLRTQAVRHLAHGIPPALMTVGGVAGSPAGLGGAVAGAAAGGYGGRLLEEYLLHAMGIAPDHPALARAFGAAPGSRMASTLGAAQEGATGAVSEFTGAKAAELLEPVANAIYRQALGKGGQVAREGMATGTPVSRGGLERVSAKGDRIRQGITQLERSGAGNAATQPLRNDLSGNSALEAALERAVERHHSTLLPLLTGGGTYAGSHDPLAALLMSLLTHAAGSPAVTSRAAMGLATPAAADVVRNVPRAASTLIEQLMLNQGGE